MVGAGKHSAQWLSAVWPACACELALWEVTLWEVAIPSSVAETAMWQGMFAALTGWSVPNAASTVVGIAHALPAAMRASNTVNSRKRSQTMAA